MEELNKIVRAIGSFILTCIVFGVPITTAFILHTKHINFFAFVLLTVSIIEFIFMLCYFYISSE